MDVDHYLKEKRVSIENSWRLALFLVLIPVSIFLTKTARGSDICTLSEFLAAGTTFEMRIHNPEAVKSYALILPKVQDDQNEQKVESFLKTPKYDEKQKVLTGVLKDELEGTIVFAKGGELLLTLIDGKGKQGGLSSGGSSQRDIYLFEKRADEQIDVIVNKDQQVVLDVSKGGLICNEEGTDCALPPNPQVTISINYGVRQIIRMKQGAWYQRISDRFGKATLEIKGAGRTAQGRKITAVLTKPGHRFTDKNLEVCFRPLGATGLGRPYLRSPSVDLVKPENNRAELNFVIPKFKSDTLKMGGVMASIASFGAYPIEVKLIETDKDGHIVLEASQAYNISNVIVAVFVAGFVFMLVYSLPFIIFRDRFRFNPIWLARGVGGKASLSKFQIWMWTLLVFTSAVYVLCISGQLVVITKEILLLLGITGGVSMASKLTAIAREDRGMALYSAQKSHPIKKPAPEWKDLISTDGRFDVYKFQMLIFTVLIALYVFFAVLSNLHFPEVPQSFLWLMGISNGVYLGGKFTSGSAFSQLEALHRQIEIKNTKINADEETLSQLKASGKLLDDKLQKAKEDDPSNEAQIDEISKNIKEKDEQIKKTTQEIAETREQIKELKSKYDAKSTEISGLIDTKKPA